MRGARSAGDDVAWLSGVVEVVTSTDPQEVNCDGLGVPSSMGEERDRAPRKRRKPAPQAEVPGGNTGITNRTNNTADSAASRNGDDFLMAIAAHAEALRPESLEGEELRRIARKALGGANVNSDLNKYLTSCFTRRNTGGRPKEHHGRPKEAICSKRKRRRCEYARLQQAYQKSRLRCAQEVLDGVNTSKVTDHRGFLDFWKGTMTEQPPEPSFRLQPPREVLSEIWRPVTVEDVKNNLPKVSTASGPDGLTARELRGMPLNHLALILNLFLWSGAVPEVYTLSRTTMIPKVDGAKHPGDFRPIAVSPVLLRTLHKILAKRVQLSVEFDERQRAFIPADGCGENIAILQAILKESQRTTRSCYMATMDMRKAFDTVSVPAVLSAAHAAGLPQPLLRYLQNIYSRNRTLVRSGSLEEEISAVRGVKQGDPLSPLLFNCVIDQLLKELPEHIGFDLNGSNINAMAFADDLTLVASTSTGLQMLLDKANAFLRPRGLAFNAKKSSTLSLVASGREKRTKVEQVPFRVDGHLLRSLTCLAEWKYLGVVFGPRGKAVPRLKELAPLLSRITAAPLKPQQRLVLLKHFLLPRLYHKCAFGTLTAGLLNAADITVRAAVRRWLRLPDDTPVGFFHAPVASGGLGIPALRHMIPRLKLSRLESLKGSKCASARVAAETAAIKWERQKAQNLMMLGGTVLRTAAQVNAHWAALLHQSVDGQHLVWCADVPEGSSWISDGTSFLRGCDFVDYVRLRAHALVTRSRCSRGRVQERNCRAGCPKVESLAHITQHCPRTHGERVKRHNVVLDFACKQFSRHGWEVEREPRIQTSLGVRIPDIILKSTDRTAVVDVQVSGPGSLEVAHVRKSNKYGTIPEVVQYAAGKLPGVTPLVTSLTLSYRGIWSKTSRDVMHGLGLTKKDVRIMTTMAMQGSMNCYRAFMRSTFRTDTMMRG